MNAINKTTPREAPSYADDNCVDPAPGIKHNMSDDEIRVYYADQKGQPECINTLGTVNLNRYRKLGDEGKLELPEISYDSNRTAYWVNNSNDGWITVGVTDVRRKLKMAGYNDCEKSGERVSEVTSLIESIQNVRYIDYAGLWQVTSLAFI